MKFDMGRAWSDAVSLIAANRDLVIIMAAVFLFLPSLILSVVAPGSEVEQAAQNPEQMQAALAAYFASNWPILLVYGIVSTVGTLAILALLGRPQRPTVGEAIAIGAKATLPYIAASILIGIAAGLIFGLIAAVGAVAGMAVAGILGFIGILFVIFLAFRLVLVAPVMAIDDVLNPVAAIKRSWGLVKGNTRYVVGFLLLLIIALIVVSMVLGLVFALIAALAGSGEIALWINAILSGLMGAVFSMLLLAVYASIHKQLSGHSPEAVGDTFS